MKTIAFNRAPAEDQQLADLVEEITARLQAGEICDVDQYVGRYPEYADRLRGWIGTMTAMADLGHSLAGGTANRTTPDSQSAIPNPKSEIEIASPQLREPAAGILGDFRIVRELGRGGMGVVYEAEQISIGRRVALKVLPFAAMLDKQQLNRFKNEARAAGTLDHSNIVQIYSVGCERGVHFYAMQLVEGMSLAELIAEMKPSSPAPEDKTAQMTSAVETPLADDTVKAALLTVRANGNAPFSAMPPYSSREYFRAVAGLGIQAAEALDHAHQNGILHRDIKPANLLLDDSGKLWITDFGLARIEQDAGLTMTGDLLGTLRYMSPEQALAKRVVVDHRSDIYSLGATLYELLALRPAFTGDDRQELLHQIAFDEPRDLRQLDARIPVELETICLKAIRKLPEHRYLTAHELAVDLLNYLDHKPIKARPPTWRERAVKWSQRHPAAVWAATFCLVATTLVTGASTLLIARAYRHESAERHQAEISEQRAQDNARRAEAISKFLARAFESPNPVHEGRAVTVAEVLTRAERDLDSELRDQPLTQATLLTAIGRSRLSLGLWKDAVGPLTKAHQIRVEVLGEDHNDSLESLTLLAHAYGFIDRAEQMRLLESALKLQREKSSTQDPKTINTMEYLANVYANTNRNEDAISLLTQVADARRTSLGPNDPDTISTLACLAIAKASSHRLWRCYGDEAAFLAYASGRSFPQGLLPSLERAAAAVQQQYGNDHPKTLDLKELLGIAYCGAGRCADAAAIYKQCLLVYQNKYGADHPVSVAFTWHLRTAIKAQISAYRKAGQAEEADRFAAHAMADCVADGRYAIAIGLLGLAPVEQVEAVVKQALADDCRRLPTGIDALVMGDLRLLAGEPASALEAIEAAIAHDRRDFFYNNLGQALLSLGKSKEARTAFRRALNPQQRDDGTFDQPTSGAKPVNDWQSAEERQNATPEQLTSAYFLDLITEPQFVDAFKNREWDAADCWMTIAKRRDLAGNKTGAIEAYEKFMKESSDDSPGRAIAQWRLGKLRPAPDSTR